MSEINKIKVKGVVYNLGELSSGSGGSGGISNCSPYIVTRQDILDITVGAHLDVEATISLIEEIGIHTVLESGTYYGLGFALYGVEDYNQGLIMHFSYDSCGGINVLEILDLTFDTEENDLITVLRTNKSDIESHIFTDSYMEMYSIKFGVIAIEDMSEIKSYLSLEKLKSIFVKDND